MPAALPPVLRSRIVRYLLLHWRPKAIADEVHCGVRTVYEIQENMFIYGSPFKHRRRVAGGPRKVHRAAEESLTTYIEEQPWAMQKEMIWFLWEEWGIYVSRPTMCRILKRLRLSEKQAQRVGHRQNEELRRAWLADFLYITAEQLVFIDETMFNEATGWRHTVYAPIGQDGRYHADPSRGRHWSVLPAYTVDDYLPCTAIREGWFNADAILRWILDDLLPHCNAFPAPRSVIVMDNASVHINPRIEEVIKAHGCEVRYLPPYSPDFNPIELSFSVLKAWVRRHQDTIWPAFPDTFGEYLRYAVRRSRCDRFAHRHFRHSASGRYIFEADIQELNRRLAKYENLKQVV